MHLIILPKGYNQVGEPWNERRKIDAEATEYEWPVIEVSPTIEVVGKLIDRKGKPVANVSINGGVGNRRYGFGKTDENGTFTLTHVPKEIQLEKFEVWTRDEHFSGVIETREPLVVRVEN